MDLFRYITPIIYWLLIIVWSFVFIFYIKQLSSTKNTDKFLKFLISILAIDAFRTLFESIYFGTWYTALSEIIPIEIYDVLAQPEIVFIPKTINLITSFLILFLIVLKWLPQEGMRIETLNSLLLEKTEALEKQNLALRDETRHLTETNKKYNLATYFSPFPIMIHAEDGEVIIINKKWTEITGYTLEEINTIPKWTEKAYGNKSFVIKQTIDNLYNLGESNNEGEFSIKTKFGTTRIWDFSSAPLEKLPDGRKMVISTAVDITDRKILEQELYEREASLTLLNKELENRVIERTHEIEDKNKQLASTQIALLNMVEDLNEKSHELKEQSTKLEDANNELKDFAYIVSHDLKAPLRAISQLSYWVASDYADILDNNGKEQLALIASRAKRMDLLIKAILEYSRIGKEQFNPESVNLNEALNEALFLLDKPDHISIIIKNQLPTLTGDKTRFIQVFQNLIGNAIKFNDKPKGIITIDSTLEDDMWRFSINDNGSGINPKFHTKIFQIFQTLHARDEVESTGIGLTIVKKIINQYSGKIWVESEENEGCTFFFTLPNK